MAYKFAKQSEVKELESWCMDILHAVQEEVRDYFTFDIRLIGSGDKRLVTQNSDESFDLDYNIILQRDKKSFPCLPIGKPTHFFGINTCI